MEHETRERIAARHEEILGQPPRLPPLDRVSVADEVQATFLRLRGGVAGNADPVPLDSIHEIMFTMCRYPELWRKLMDLSIQIQGADAVLPIRDRKLAILRTGWLCQAPYEFGEHVVQAKRLGLTTDDVERAVIGSTAPGWEEREVAVLRAVEELHANTMIGDETWALLSRHFDETQRTELLILIGQFVATAYFQNALRLRLEPGNKGLAER
jgi:alkylhydroperoxidase family enzyme